MLIYKAHYNMLGDKALQLQQARELIPGVKARMRIMYDLRYINLELFRTLAVEVESVSQTVGRLAHQDFAAQDRRSSGSGPDCGSRCDCGPRCGFCARGPVCGPCPCGNNPPGFRCGFPCPRTRLQFRPPRQPARLPLRLLRPRTVAARPPRSPPGPAPRSAPHGPFAAPAPAAAALSGPGPLGVPRPPRPLGGPGRRQRMIVNTMPNSLRADRIGVPSRSSASGRVS